MPQTRIIIAGAGPVGVVSALALARHGYAVTLLEADAVIDDNPRAAATHPKMKMENGVRQTFLLFCCFAKRSIRFA